MHKVSDELSNWSKAEMLRFGQGPVEVVQLDLANLAAVKRGAQQIHEVAPHLDYVILNAGVRCSRHPSFMGGVLMEGDTDDLA